jgi:hypothetical protein
MEGCQRGLLALFRKQMELKDSRGFKSYTFRQIYRELPEWSIGARWKRDGGESFTGVRIPYSLPDNVLVV